MNTWKRTVGCGELTVTDVDATVRLNGWVNRRRDFGDLVFIDVRDRTGLVQVVADASVSRDVLEQAGALGREYVVAVEGAVRLRRPGTANAAMATGEIEVAAARIDVLNASEQLPFGVADDEFQASADETLRVQYRYLDLRRPDMYRRLKLRHQAVKYIRDFLDGHGFLEVETPLFTKSTPEGARDYLVPYRLNPGMFYALPQSPQQYKQLLMVGGVERYFQIARCFRDEAQRADRQPEFTQLDLEMSFIEQEDVLSLIEELHIGLVRAMSGKSMLTPFPRFTYDEAMDLYGTDKPDIRFGLEVVRLNGIAARCDFGVFRSAVDAGGGVAAVRYPGGSALSRREVDELGAMAREAGAGGLATIAVTELSAAHVKSALSRYFDATEMEAILTACHAEQGDLLCLVADAEPDTVNVAISRLRLEIGRRLNLRSPDMLCFCWITDFPLVKWDEANERWDSEHHPFTMPHEQDLPKFDTDPAAIRAHCYDLVCNGQESGSGSIRIHRADIQERVFDLLGISRERQQERFGHILKAFSYGAPPHGGIATGIDRLIMNLLGEANIREVIAFPKTGMGYDPLMDSPSRVDQEQLDELGLAVKRQKQ
ncbi:MAG: aspartate--tRNA ligase [Armatimonadetes bacterium]|nr:aspartate--tRNA ligase [Armatimonadota bacterium]MDE2206489.1 aspartate--tRNA ligase [Armatimonadota bacterium]